MKVLDTNLVFAVRCRDCGKIIFHSLSIFQLHENSRMEFHCECGNLDMIVQIKNKRNILVEMPCLACDMYHNYKYSFKDIFRRRLTTICCPETGLELCFLGMEKDVRDIVDKYQEDINRLLVDLGLSY